MPNYSNSSLATVRILTKNYGSRTDGRFNNPSGIIDHIVIHHMAGVMSAESCGNWFKSGTDGASSNYGIGRDGDIGLYVEEKNRSWATSSGKIDCRAVTIEVSNSVAGGEWPVSDASYESLIKLVADICKRNGIKRLNYTGDKSGNLHMHKWYASTACPGPYLEARFPDIANQVNNILSNPSYNPTRSPSSVNISIDSSIPADTTTAYALAVNGGILPSPEQIDPYVITINRKVKSVDFKKIKELGVIGIVVELGFLFDSTHSKVEFRNPNLVHQIKMIQDENLLYGMYFNGRARTIKEAKEEMYEVYLAVKSFHPNLGFWLVPSFTGNKTKNDEILNFYKETLEELGLKGQIGIYTKREELKKIDWEKDSEDWLLWIDDHIDAFNNITEILTPMFFAYNNQ